MPREDVKRIAAENEDGAKRPVPKKRSSSGSRTDPYQSLWSVLVGRCVKAGARSFESGRSAVSGYVDIRTQLWPSRSPKR